MMKKLLPLTGSLALLGLHQNASAQETPFDHNLPATDLEVSDEYLNPETRPKKCYGLALADSVDFGPYQAGALIELLKHQQNCEEKYNVITGVALGAINAYIISTWPADAIENVQSDLSK